MVRGSRVLGSLECVGFVGWASGPGQQTGVAEVAGVVGDSKFSKSYKVTKVTEVTGVVGDSKF